MEPISLLAQRGMPFVIVYLRKWRPREVRLSAQDLCELDGAWAAPRPALFLALSQLVLCHSANREHTLILISPSGSVLSPLPE